MTKLITILLLFNTAFAQKKVEFRGLFAGVQTIAPINKPVFSHSVYIIALVGKGRFTFNTQVIYWTDSPLIKFGLDYKIL